MDKVELVGRVGPGQGHIIDLENAIRRDEGGLNRGEVDSGDLGAGIFIGHISASEKDRIVSPKIPIGRISVDNSHGPDSGPGADIEDLLGVLQGREMEFSIEGQVIHVMRDILLFVGGFVVGALCCQYLFPIGIRTTYPVRAIAVGMVTSAELEAIVGDITGQGLGIVPDKGIVAIGRVQIIVPIVHIFQSFIVIFFAGGGIERISCGRSITAVPGRSGGVGAPRGRSNHHDEDLHSG